MQRLGERLGPSRRFRIPYLRSLAVLAEWDGHEAQTITHLREAAEIGLPGEQWQIQARLAWEKATTIIQGLADGITDEALRARFLAGPQIQPVFQHAQGADSPLSQDHAEQQER